MLIKIKSVFLKSILFFIALFSMSFITGCRICKHEQPAKYGIPSSYYKKINTSENTCQASKNDLNKY